MMLPIIALAVSCVSLVVSVTSLRRSLQACRRAEASADRAKASAARAEAALLGVRSVDAHAIGKAVGQEINRSATTAARRRPRQ